MCSCSLIKFDDKKSIMKLFSAVSVDCPAYWLVIIPVEVVKFNFLEL